MKTPHPGSLGTREASSGGWPRYPPWQAVDEGQGVQVSAGVVFVAPESEKSSLIRIRPAPSTQRRSGKYRICRGVPLQHGKTNNKQRPLVYYYKLEIKSRL